VLLIHSDAATRNELSHVLRQAGKHVRAAASIAEVERWPRRDVVITDARSFTPLWLTVGAVHVVVLGDDGCGIPSTPQVTRLSARPDAQALLAALESAGVAAA
jgi:hypothetical protein